MIDVISSAPSLGRGDVEVLESDGATGRGYIVVLRVVIEVNSADATGVTGSDTVVPGVAEIREANGDGAELG